MKTKCDGCGHKVELDRQGRYVTHSTYDGEPMRWSGVGNRPGCETGGLFPIEGGIGGSVHPGAEIQAGQWESNRRKH